MTNQQEAPEALRLAELLELAPEDGVEPQTAEDAAAELRRKHAECEALLAERERNLNSIRVCNEIINKKNAELESLTTGYAAARLEIESLQARIKTMAEEHADELMVAHLDGRMRAAQPAGEYPALPSNAFNIDPGSGGNIRGYSADQMRAYADETCAMRAEQPAGAQQPTTQPAPQQEAQRPWGYAWRQSPFGWGFCSKQAYEQAAGRGEEVAKLYTAPQQEPDEIRSYAAARAWIASAAHAPADSVTAPAAGAVAGPTSGLHPEKCPITGRPFFMTLDHPELGRVPTYGGPYDSYTIPAPEGEPKDPWHERELRSERYDHDAGWWVEGGEPIPLRIVHEDVLFKLQEDAEAAAAPTAPAQTADSVLEDAARESEYRRGYRHGYEQRDAEVRGALA